MVLDSLGDWERTHDCGTLGADDTGSGVALGFNVAGITAVSFLSISVIGAASLK